MKFKFVFLFNLIFISNFFLNVQAFENKKNEIGFYFGSKIYEERDTKEQFVMSQDGYMIGLISASADYNQGSYFGWITKLAAGEVDYTSNGTGTMTGIPDYQFETTGYLGIPFEGSNYRITSFGGLGFRYLLNASGLRLSSTGHAGYDRESRYLYVPLGINIESSPVNNSYWEFRAEYLHFISGQQTSYLSQVSSNYSDFTNDQDKGSGIKLTYKYHFDSSFGIEGYSDYWDIADSKPDASGNFYEPRNSTSEAGIRIFWSY
jgi:hypothetical protein